VRTLLENGIYDADPVEINGVMVSPFEVIMAHIRREAKEEWEDPFELSESLGFNPHCVLSTDINGYKNGVGKRIVCHNQMPYPYFGGKAVTSSMEYGSYVGLPCSVTLQLIHQGEVPVKGLTTIENSGFSPQRFLAELEKRKVTFTSEKNVKGQHNLAEKPQIPLTATRAHRDWSLLE
jgi:saccharopine dehydrogenase-like NADP-dependent oxidoreductase